MLPIKNNFSIILIGPTYTGKTCIIQKYVHHLDKICLITTATEFFHKTINLDENTKIRLKILDTPSIERYRSILLTSLKFR